MRNESVLYGIIGLLAGLLIAGGLAVLAVNSNNTGMMQMMGMNTSRMSQGMMDDDDMSMGGMSEMLKGKSGDEFDEAFLEQMIIHHQGAIDMAELIQSRAKHDEIKDLGKNIITAQTKEIEDMKQWQKDWSYDLETSRTDSHNMMH